jgi:hypothetical protein
LEDAAAVDARTLGPDGESFGTGDLQARLMTTQRPMKMAAAEGPYDTGRIGVGHIGGISGPIDPHAWDVGACRGEQTAQTLPSETWKGRIS